jgi:hypothetical protein
MLQTTECPRAVYLSSDVIVTCQTHNSSALDIGLPTLSSVVGESVPQHRLRRLRATAPLPVIELVDALAVRAHFAFQNHTTSFAA